MPVRAARNSAAGSIATDLTRSRVGLFSTTAVMGNGGLARYENDNIRIRQQASRAWIALPGLMNGGTR
jgi:hypothetical protein